MEVERDFRRWPDAGVGIPTGEVNRIFVLEADTVEGHGVDGVASLKALEARHGLLPETLMAQSPSGSIHRYFNWPGKEIKNSAGKLARGVDVKGVGGMVVAPPTRTPKGSYRWLNALPIVDAPPWVIDRALRRRPLTSWFERGYRRQSGEQRSADRKPITNAQLRELMSSIPNDDATDWEEWNRIGMAIYAATNGSGFGFWLFDGWSQKHYKYDPDATLEKWTSSEPRRRRSSASARYSTRPAARNSERKWKPGRKPLVASSRRRHGKRRTSPRRRRRRSALFRRGPGFGVRQPARRQGALRGHMEQMALL